MSPSRREVLHSTGAAGIAPLSLWRRRPQQRITRRFLVQHAEDFEDNYAGQWIQVTEQIDEEADAVETCEFANWAADETQAYDALLLDRRSEESVSVEVTAYANGTQSAIEPHTVFIINSTQSCNSDYVGLDAETVPRRAVAGEPAGPTVTEADGQPGFGIIGLLVAVVLGGIARLVNSRRR